MSAKKAVTADAQKKAAAVAALKFVTSGMKIGLGTGSTANHFTVALAQKVKQGLDVQCVPTSKATRTLATELGLKITNLNEVPFLDYTFDGADEFDPQFRLVKGGGGALLIEKIVATSSRYVVTMADQSKQVKKLGAFPLPVEVVDVGVRATVWKMDRVFRKVNMEPKLAVRLDGDKPFRTDCGNVIIDCVCGEIKEPDRLDIMLNNLPGVVDNGLFINISGIIMLGKADGTVEELRRE